MKTAGSLLRVIGVLIGIFGILSALSAFSNPFGFLSGIGILIGSITMWILLYGIGEAFSRLEDIAVNVERSTDALIRIAGKAPGSTQDLPPVSAMPISPRRKSNVEKLLGRRS